MKSDYVKSRNFISFFFFYGETKNHTIYFLVCVLADGGAGLKRCSQQISHCQQTLNEIVNKAQNESIGKTMFLFFFLEWFWHIYRITTKLLYFVFRGTSATNTCSAHSTESKYANANVNEIWKKWDKNRKAISCNSWIKMLILHVSKVCRSMPDIIGVNWCSEDWIHCSFVYCTGQTQLYTVYWSCGVIAVDFITHSVSVIVIIYVLPSRMVINLRWPVEIWPIWRVSTHDMRLCGLAAERNDLNAI